MSLFLITGTSNFTFELPTTSNSKLNFLLARIAYDIFFDEIATELPTTYESKFISLASFV